MKQIIRVATLALLLPGMAFAQSLADIGKQASGMETALGVSFIDGEAHLSLVLTPDLAFGNFGVGLNIELLFDIGDSFKFRDAGWKGDGGILRAINYVRWGTKGKPDPVYGRIGSLTAATIGNGMIMSYYNNSADYDNRKTGLELDIDFGIFGFESVVNTFVDLEILGGRVYFRPLHGSKMPILENIEIGGSVVGDVKAATNDRSITIIGADIGVPIVKTEMFQYKLYLDFASIIDYGQGFAAGMLAKLDLMKLVEGWARFEWRLRSDRFVPSYFNSLYEYEKNIGKLDALEFFKSTSGPYGELGGHILNIVKLVGSYQYANGGILHLEAGVSDDLPIKLVAAYDKTGIENFGDFFSFDERSVVSAEIGFKSDFWFISMLYRWNFVYNEATGEYDTQRRIEPRVGLSFTF